MANRCTSLGLLGSWRLYTWLTGALLLAFLALGGYIHGYRCSSLGLLGSWRLYTWLTGALLLAFLALGGYIHG